MTTNLTTITSGLDRDILALAREALNDALGDRGRFNLLAVGKTGAGKSSLINAIFGWDVAAVGSGRPVTDRTVHYEHPHLPLGFYDTRGAEVGEDLPGLIARLVAEVTSRRDKPAADQIHVVWYCVRWSDRRLEDGQAELIRALAGTALPVIVVLTQVPLRDSAYHVDAVRFGEFIAELGLPVGPGTGVFLTAAVDDPWTGPIHGLRDLVDATIRVAPEGVQSAVTAAQQIDLDRKQQACRQIVLQHAAFASAAAATPIPAADAAAIVPVQVAMIARTCAAWGLDVPRATLASVVGSALMASGATVAGRLVTSNLLRLVPGVGSVLGGAISAAVAGTLTLAVGEAWTRLLLQIAGGGEQISDLSGEEVRRRFHEQFRRNDGRHS